MTGDDKMKKKSRLKKIADQVMDFPFGILTNDPLSKVENEKIINKTYTTTIKSKEWEFQKDRDNPEWFLQQSAKNKK